MEKQKKLRHESSPGKKILGDSNRQNILSSNISSPNISLKGGIKHGSLLDDTLDHYSSKPRQLNVSSSTGLSFTRSTIPVCSSARTSVLDEKFRKKNGKLNLWSQHEKQLFFDGLNNIKVRGKTFQIKTPVCKALNQLNGLDNVDYARVTDKLNLELNAKDGTTWAAVQGVSHNPRVKVYVPFERTLASVILYFEEKWKTSSDSLKEQFLHTGEGRTLPRLRFILTDKNDMNLPIYKISEVTSSAKKLNEKILKENDKTTDIFVKNKKRQGGWNPENDLGDFDPGNVRMTRKTPVKCFKNTNRFKPYVPSMSIVTQLGPPIDKCLLSPNQQKYYSNNIVQTSEDYMTSTSKKFPVSDICASPLSTKGEENLLSHVCDKKAVRRGWTVDEAGTLTCGELYLMLGENDKLCFEYYWDKGENTSSNKKEEIKLIDRLVEVAKVLKKRKTLAHSNSKFSSPMFCSKCSYKLELTINNLCSLPISTQTHESSHPSTTGEQTIRLLSEKGKEEANQESIYHGVPEIKLHRKKISRGSKVELGLGNQKIHESFVSTRHEGMDTNIKTFGHLRPILPKLTMGSPFVPPTFSDLPKGNRRPGRPVSKRIVVVPKLLPLKSKIPEFFQTLVSSKKNSTVEQIHKYVIQPDSYTVIGSNEFEQLIKSGQGNVSMNLNNSFSLSSFMDISITESNQLGPAPLSLNNSTKNLNEVVIEQSSSSCNSLNFTKFLDLLDTCSARKVESDSTLNNTSMI